MISDKLLIKDFFDFYEYINSLSDIILKDNSFLSDIDINDEQLEINYNNNDYLSFLFLYYYSLYNSFYLSCILFII